MLDPPYLILEKFIKPRSAFYLQRFLDFQRAGYQYGWKWIEKFLAYVTREEKKKSQFQVIR
ncbi:hypothetical protein SC09_contig10orf00020 [Bacillus subtilis]|uniref:Uncharacterized protein n=1 Tax=Bacillus subtilis TaxID=1423 RepID=A0A0D1KUC3_BACIU|nr:hypothetical protein SC09_contig10orf00020 [Bacillus subtilis]